MRAFRTHIYLYQLDRINNTEMQDIPEIWLEKKCLYAKHRWFMQINVTMSNGQGKRAHFLQLAVEEILNGLTNPKPI